MTPSEIVKILEALKNAGFSINPPEEQKQNTGTVLVTSPGSTHYAIVPTLAPDLPRWRIASWKMGNDIASELLVKLGLLHHTTESAYQMLEEIDNYRFASLEKIASIADNWFYISQNQQELSLLSYLKSHL